MWQNHHRDEDHKQRQSFFPPPLPPTPRPRPPPPLPPHTRRRGILAVSVVSPVGCRRVIRGLSHLASNGETCQCGTQLWNVLCGQWGGPDRVTFSQPRQIFACQAFSHRSAAPFPAYPLPEPRGPSQQPPRATNTCPPVCRLGVKARARLHQGHSRSSRVRPSQPPFPHDGSV